MGFFGTYLYAGGAWADADPNQPLRGDESEPWMYLEIHDSSVGTVRFAPAGVGRGEAFLGVTPRLYFDDPTASAPTDPTREAAGLATWVAAAVGSSVTSATIEAFLAGDDDEEVDDTELDDEEVFVEMKVQRFLTTLGLPLPNDLQTS